LGGAKILVSWGDLLRILGTAACRSDAAAVAAAIAVYIALTLTVANNVGGLVVGWGMASCGRCLHW